MFPATIGLTLLNEAAAGYSCPHFCASHWSLIYTKFLTGGDNRTSLRTSKCFPLTHFCCFEWADKVTGEGLQRSCFEFSSHIYCLNSFQLKKVWNCCVENDAVSKLSLQDYKICLERTKGLCLLLLWAEKLSETHFYHRDHWNILLVCARDIRPLIYCPALDAPVSNSITVRGRIHNKSTF